MDSIHLISFKLWQILTVELIYAVSCYSFMPTMQLGRMSRPWKPLWERRRSLLRIWFVTNNYWNNPMLMSLLEVNLIFYLYLQLYLDFLDKFERKFVTQGAYDTRNIFQSLDLAWTLLRIFPRELLHRIPAKTLDQYYSRDATHWSMFRKIKCFLSSAAWINWNVWTCGLFAVVIYSPVLFFLSGEHNSFVDHFVTATSVILCHVSLNFHTWALFGFHSPELLARAL